MEQMRKLPIGIQTFEEIRRDRSEERRVGKEC